MTEVIVSTSLVIALIGLLAVTLIVMAFCGMALVSHMITPKPYDPSKVRKAKISSTSKGKGATAFVPEIKAAPEVDPVEIERDARRAWSESLTTGIPMSADSIAQTFNVSPEMARTWIRTWTNSNAEDGTAIFG